MKIAIRLILTAALLSPLQPRAEEMPSAPSAENEPKTWTFNAGLGSPKVWNYAGITREFLIDDHTAYFVTAGLGTALIGAGVVYYGNRTGNGIVLSSAIGVVDLQATVAYQLKTGPQDFVSIGASYGSFFMQCTCWAPLVLGYEHRY